MIPDNYSDFESYESEIDRQERRRKRLEQEEDINPKDLPFYYDPQTYIELGGKKPWKKQ
ncbi:hypothetical protein [Anaerocolumna chitinilytica]|uniref:Uncharacterized protein n=1 Tax=Anaerocolumna chitinilytica TaxID=1727145 RepID=A0A7M3SAL7_9FIRM|nr:hypothetical protein [Anaerocolumna chitinilytica]BCK01635.1 hypothetical protein bsdcttw_46750 [Anaerocolumna chitinilytica]